jgi:hypothetical protein
MSARALWFLVSTALLVSGCDSTANKYRVVGELASDRVELAVETAEPITEILVSEGE